MVKKDLVNDLSEAFPEISKKDVSDIVALIFENIGHALLDGEPVEIRGFGRLSVRERSPIRARNPRSGESVDVPQRWAVHFKPSPSLNQTVNK